MNRLYFLTIAFFCFTSLFSQTFDVQHYELNINVPNSYNKYIEGHTVINLKFLEDNISDIDLMLLALEIDSIKLGSNLLTYTYNDPNLNIQLSQAYQSNDLLELDIFYHGNGHTDSDGWGGYLSSVGYAFNLGVSMSSDPHSYGRAWYPCVDNFTDKATYNFNITCQEQRTAVCGGTLTNEVNNGDGTKTFSWNLNREIPSYLTSIAVGNYEVYRDTFTGILGEIPVAIYARDQEINNVESSFIHLEQIFHNYETRFGAYRWSRIGYVAVPFNGGAMEHAENIAYPNNSIDGTTNDESLYAHELAHSWFGNLTTCSTAEDMWLNEGWASYCEAITQEGIYGTTAFKEYNRNRHKKNIQDLQYDEGFLAIYGIPTELTYGSHVYKKGADVVHSLRGHLGDDLFFSVMINFLTDHQFESVSSYNLRDYLTANTPYDLTGFFDSWVFDAGWLHFSVDSFLVTPNAGQYDVQVFMRQKLKGKTEFGQNNRIPIQFLSENFERIDTVITISGENDSQTFTIPFNPYSVLCDMEEQISDATTDIYETYNSTGDHAYYKSYFKNTVSQISDSVLFRVEHNWVAPDDFQQEIPNLYIHPSRYWKVDGIFNNDFVATGKFYYSTAVNLHLDDEFITTSVDSIVMLYKANSGDDWQIIPHTVEGSAYSGYMYVENLQRGEYAFAIWDHHVGNSNLKKDSNLLDIYPNPSHDFFIIKTQNSEHIDIEIYDLSGQIIEQRKSEDSILKVSTKNWTPGVYLVKYKQQTTRLVVE